MIRDRHFPETLKDRKIWGLWRLERNDKSQLTKVPYSPHYDGRASSTDPKTWGTFDEVVSKYESRPGYYNGLALFISSGSGLVFIDIDHCIDEDGLLTETAFDIIGSFDNQYMEKSQSGSGVHIIAKGQIPKNFNNRTLGVEMYSTARFCAMTGDALFNGEPSEDQTAIDHVFGKYKTPEKEKQTVRRTSSKDMQREDRWIVEHASRHGKFKDLYEGNWTRHHTSQSEADLGLCLILSFWTDCDPEQIDRIFQSSELYREKWDRPDYKNNTIGNAISQCEETLSEYIRKRNIERGNELEKALSENWDR